MAKKTAMVKQNNSQLRHDTLLGYNSGLHDTDHDIINAMWLLSYKLAQVVLTIHYKFSLGFVSSLPEWEKKCMFLYHKIKLQWGLLKLQQVLRKIHFVLWGAAMY